MSDNVVLNAPATKRPLPNDWRWARLGDVCESRTGTRDPSSEPDKPFRYVDISSVDNDAKRIVASRALLGKEAPSRARQVIRTNDVIVSTTRPNLNAVALVPAELDDQVCSTGFCVLRAKSNLEPAYLFAFVQSTAFVQSLSDLVKGALYPAVTDKQVRDQRIPLPPLPEQRRLAALLAEQLAEVDRARRAAEAQVAAAKALPAAYLRSVFESEEARRWPVMPLGEAGAIGSGITLGRKLNGSLTRPVPYLRVANVKEGFLDLTDVYQIEATEAEAQKYRLQYGDLLLTEGGDPDKLGRGTFWEEQIPNCIHQNHIFRVRFDPAEFSPRFVAAQISSPYGKAYFLSHAKQTTGIATINQRVLAAFPLMVTPFSEQQRIVAMLIEQMTAAEQGCAALKAQLAAVEKLPAALLRRAFSGAVGG